MGAEIFALLLAFGVEIIAVPPSFHLTCLATSSNSPSVKLKVASEKASKFVLLGEQAQLMCFGGIGRIDLETSLAMKDSAKDDAIYGLRIG